MYWWYVSMYVLVAVVEILLILKAYLKITTGRCKSNDSLIGKTVLITGANSGLGFETSLDMARRGARVILACRNEEKAREACNKIKKETSNGDVIYKIVDFASLTSVRKLAEDINATERCLDVLINNAGAGGLGNKYTEDGLQLTMQVNYFAPFLLTNLLLGLLTKSPSSRIINISSIAAKFGTMDIKNINEYKGDTAQYCISKLCNIIFTIELASRLKDTNITTFSLHPGVTNTELFQTMPYIMRKITYFILTVFGKSAKEGAQTSIYLAVERDIESFSGQHFHDCRPVKRYGNVDVTLAKQLWEKTEEIVKLNAS